jgi:uncharacterized protein
MDKNEIIKIAEDYANLLKINDYKVKKIYLFGSYTKNNNRNDSDIDIDIAVIIENVLDIQDELIKLMKFRRKIDNRIEPHPLDYKDFINGNPFISEILKTGIEIQ